MNATVNLRTLLCHKDVELAIHCLSSAVHYSADQVQLVIHEDGSLTAVDRDLLAQALPGCRIIDRHVSDEFMMERLSRHPNARAFRQQSVWGLKLLDVILAESGICFYMDSDICFFRPFEGLFTDIATAGRCVFLRDTVWQAYSIRPWHLLDSRRLRVASGINTGLTLIDPIVYDLDFVDWFLGHPDWRVIPAWAEPTCWAALALRASGHAVDPLQITNLYPCARVSEQALGGHFLSSYRAQWKELLQPQLELSVSQPEQVRFVPLNSLTPVALGMNQLKRKLQNKLGF